MVRGEIARVEPYSVTDTHTHTSLSLTHKHTHNTLYKTHPLRGPVGEGAARTLALYV